MTFASSFRARRQGLTLIELLIVLIILVALAGILVPLLPDVQQQSHGAAGADNMKEIAKAMQLHKATTGTFPDTWDSLIDANGVVAATTDLTALDLSAAGATEDAVRAALFAAGITETLEHTDLTIVDGSINQTFEGTGGLELDITDEDTATGNVAQLNLDGEARLGLEQSVANGGDGPLVYVAFGLGANSTAVGRSMLDAPVHFLEGGESPIENYARWVVVFAVPAEGPLRLAAVAAVHDGEELAGMNAHLAEYYEALE